MDLTEQEIKEFQKIYFEVFKEKISFEEAETKAKSLLGLAAASMGLDFEDLFSEIPNNRLKNFRFEPPKKATGE